MRSYECEKCGRRWHLTVGGDGEFHFNRKPIGRAAGRCYCGSGLGGKE